MRLFFLFLLFFVVHNVYGENAKGTQCFLPTVDIRHIVVNKDFIANVANCTEWIGQEGNGHPIYIEGDMTQDVFNRTFKNIKKVSKLTKIYFHDNDKLTSLVFPSLKSIDSLFYFEFRRFRKVKTISFPELDDELPLKSLKIVGMDSLDVTSIDNLMKKFVGGQTLFKGEVCDGSNIVDVSSLSKCKYLRRMNFAENTNGTVKSKITYVKEELKITGTRLRNVDFLKLDPLNDKHNTTCEIANNTFCKFDQESVVKMIEDVYVNCTIENNLDGECKCNFPDKEYKVDNNFVRYYSDCLEWIGGDEGTRIVMDNAVTQGMFDTILMDLTRISRVSLKISNNGNLTKLNFSNLITFGEEGENITAVFTSNPKVETILFPEISKSTVHLVTRDMYSLSQESIKHLNEKFPSGEIVHYKECVINGNISDLSVLSNCSSLTSLQFIPNIRGNVTSSIEFVRGDLIIKETLLENINFLQLLPQDPKNKNKCKVANNKFCDYNETMVKEILENAHSGCVFENNIGKYCVCDLSNELYVVNQEFLESFSNCSEWISSNANGSRVVMQGDWKEDTFIHVFGNLTKISGVSFEISENHVLTRLEFPKLESFGEKGQEISAEFKFNSKVQSISFPNISMESSGKIVTKGMHSLSEESIATLNGKFKNDGIAPFGVCHLREGQTILIDRDFVRDYWNCSAWISSKATILIDPDTILMRFRRAFSKVKKISGASIEIHQNVHLVSLLFPRIESFGNTKFTLRINHCPRIRNISFPRLLNTSSKNLKIHIHGKNEMSKRTIKRLKFAHYTNKCTFKYPISKDSMLYNCRNVTSLEFTAGLVGIVRDPIKYIDKDLIIRNTRLRDLDFLQLAPQKKKNVNNCSIVGNNLCRFDAGKLTKTVLRYYRSCTIENNLNNTSCEHYPTPKPYRPRRNLQFDSRGYYIPPKGEDWWRMPALFACSIVFLFFLCWNCN